MFLRLHQVHAREGFFTNQSDLDKIIDANEGDLRNAINALQAYHTIPEDERQQFLVSICEPEIDAARILSLCIKEKQVEEAVKCMGTPANLRKTIDSVFNYGINSPAKPESKLLLVDAATQAQRDLLSGVESHYVMWDFCRRLAE